MSSPQTRPAPSPAAKPAPTPSKPAAPAPPPVQSRPIVPIRIKSGDRRAHYRTFLSYGRTRSGKTRFLATWPRLLVIAEASEHGWSTIESMPADDFYRPEEVPLVWPVEDASQMTQALNDAEPLVRSGKVQTVGIDSLTFYQDAYFQLIKSRAMESVKRNPGSKLDTRALFGNLYDHLHEVRQRIHRWPCNVGWLALESPPNEEHPTGGPLITGKARERFPAGCDFVYYHRSYSIPTEEDKTKSDLYFEMHTQPFGKWVAGGRDSGLLEPSIFQPTYRQLAAQLGLPEDVLEGLPKL